MIRHRPAASRGQSKWSWLDSRHSFSFNRYHDPENMGFRTLRVINDDFIAPGGKFGAHPHEDMEILTWVLEGSVVHEDSTGARGEIRPGDIQRMTAGTGIVHSEANGSDYDELRLLQIWIYPERRGLQPGYEQKSFSDEALRNRLRLIASPGAEEGAVRIHQDARVYAARLDSGAAIGLTPEPERGQWIQVASGAVTVNGIELGAGDGAAIESEASLEIKATAAAEILLFDLR